MVDIQSAAAEILGDEKKKEERKKEERKKKDRNHRTPTLPYCGITSSQIFH